MAELTLLMPYRLLKRVEKEASSRGVTTGHLLRRLIRNCLAGRHASQVGCARDTISKGEVVARGGDLMRPYSLDLRQRVAQAVDQREGSLRQLAKRFRVSLSFVTRLLALRRQTHSLAPRPHSRGPAPLLDRQGLRRLRQLLHDQPDAILDELAQPLGCSRMTVWRAFASSRSPARRRYFGRMNATAPTCKRSGGSSNESWPPSTPSAYSSSMSRGRRPRWLAFTAGLPKASALW